ncbi:hypothetical protein NPS53_09890 [Pseudomonas putida]|uniref:hypothetical protein n=1 Tax=Pseudomonas putida TaxID=303 RepID=UPI002363FAA7|nr:hypothetical protein [Pseudomonas putida]MDD2139890.1 hypothetical protein [Pseudomonas putida]HDS1721813.1 hypothetical protein [Pseudomonas putida]
MVLTNVMPRYGTREHQRLGILLVALLVLAVCMLMPSAAFAAFDGTFKPDTATQTNVDTSFAAWWRFIAVPGLWLSLGGLVFTCLFMGMRGWYIPLALAGIFMFGEMAIKGVKTLMA